MKLLEQLAREAELRQLSSQEQKALDREKGARFLLLEHKLEDLRDYLSSLTTLLNKQDHELQLRFDLPGYGPIVAKLDKKYVVELFKPHKDRHELRLQVGADILPNSPVIPVDGKSLIETLKASFDRYQIKGLLEMQKDLHGVPLTAKFQARGSVMLTFVATIEWHYGYMRFDLYNFQGFSHSTRSFELDEINDALFDQVGRFVARRDDALLQESIDVNLRAQLQERARLERERKQLEMRLAQQAAEEEAKQLAELERQRLPNKLLDQGKKILGKFGFGKE
jgi:hypothetical protein